MVHQTQKLLWAPIPQYETTCCGCDVIHILQPSNDVINDGLDYDHLLVSFDNRTSYRIFMGTLLLISSLITSS